MIEIPKTHSILFSSLLWLLLVRFCFIKMECRITTNGSTFLTIWCNRDWWAWVIYTIIATLMVAVSPNRNNRVRTTVAPLIENRLHMIWSYVSSMYLMLTHTEIWLMALWKPKRLKLSLFWISDVFVASNTRSQSWTYTLIV